LLTNQKRLWFKFQNVPNTCKSKYTIAPFSYKLHNEMDAVSVANVPQSNDHTYKIA